MYQFETKTSCPINNVTQNVSKKDGLGGGTGEGLGCPINNVTQNSAKLQSSASQGGGDVTGQSARDYVNQMRQRYLSASKKEKSVIISELIKNNCYQGRKGAIRALNQGAHVSQLHRRGRKPVYNDLDKQHLKKLWKSMSMPCGKRMKVMLREWLTFYHSGDQQKSNLLKISASTIDEFLAPAREEIRKKLQYRTRSPKAHIKAIIKLRDPWLKIEKPGSIETDTVVHCGSEFWGLFGYSVTTTDIISGWTDALCQLGKEAKSTVETLKEIERCFPILWTNLYFDNGIEYINYLTVKEFETDRQRGVELARGRTGRSNDQCHVEQKNNHFVRELLGYDRVESQEIVDMINDLYRKEWRQLYNFFMPQMKLIEKDRVGAKYRKKYDEPKTPYQRLVDSPHVSEEAKEKLRAEKKTLNPFSLSEIVQKKSEAIKKKIQEHEEKKRQVK